MPSPLFPPLRGTKVNRMSLLKFHRWLSICAVVVCLYLGATGSLIEMIDLRGLLTHASPYDANMQAMRGDINGPGDYAVIGPMDYHAQTLSGDVAAMMQTTARAAQAAAGAVPLRYVELRMVDGRAVGVAQLDGPARARQRPLLAFDPATGAPLPLPALSGKNEEPRDALRVQVKSLHRMTTFGNGALWINIVIGPALIALIVTGVWVYVRQYRARARMGRKALFWQAQDWWRTLHRAFSVACALFLLVLALSGTWLAVESLVFGMRMDTQMAQRKASIVDGFGTISADDTAPWAKTTLAAYGAEHPGALPRLLRLRTYGGYGQGVVVSGESDAGQLVYNARTGAAMTETEPGYPPVNFPFGWQAHQWAKQVHNGSLIGLTGRWISLICGLCILYLSVSGIVMYARLWRRRAGNGKRALFW